MSGSGTQRRSPSLSVTTALDELWTSHRGRLLARADKVVKYAGSFCRCRARGEKPSVEQHPTTDMQIDA
jgi:hypothetical protein